jgi:membrane protein DedA with SNARE-associated domain
VLVAVGDVRGCLIAYMSGRLIARARLRSGSDVLLSIDRSIRGIHVTIT